MAKSKPQSATIARNRRAGYEYSFETKYQAGLALEGWEVKSIRAGKVQLTDTYVVVRDAEAFLLNALITPLPSSSTHTTPEPSRSRKLLLHRREIREIASAIQTKGKTCVAISMYWSSNLVKVEIAIAVGKRQYDKRKAIQEREWNRQKQRLAKQLQ